MIVTGATKLCSKQNLYNDTGWETLSERRKKHKILKFHEMFHEKGPEYLNQMVPQQFFEVHNYNTRRTNDTQNVNCRTSYYKNRSYHQVFLFGTQFHNVFDQITQRLPLKVI
jgi:hypothetical protein